MDTNISSVEKIWRIYAQNDRTKMKSYKNLPPAKVRYIGTSDSLHTNGKIYNAYFLEYWQGERRSLHVSGNDGEITDFNDMKDYEIISDEANLLNYYEAVVKCKTHKYEDRVFGLKFGKAYKAIGRDKNGLYLVMDESLDCYFYPSDIFDIVRDDHGILKRQSVYYSYFG
jgi:hypothetical protein